jgi:CheY-like chemotaxis protein
MYNNEEHGPISILLVEDNPADVRLMQEVLKPSKTKFRSFVVKDGAEAMLFLHRSNNYSDKPVPDIIILDLNLPQKDGREVLSEIKQDEKLKHIPVIVLTTSSSIDDINRCYRDHANCYITKPIDLERFDEIVKLIEMFWFMTVMLPRNA